MRELAATVVVAVAFGGCTCGTSHEREDATAIIDASDEVPTERPLGDAALDAVPSDAAVDAAPPPACAPALDGTPCDELYATCTTDDGCCVCSAFGFGCAMVWNCSVPAAESDTACPTDLPSDGAECDPAHDDLVCHYCNPAGYPTTSGCNDGRFYAWCSHPYCWIQYPTFSCGS
jgi:hypothetical protein